MAQPVLFNPSWTRIGTAAASRSQETRSLPRVNRTCRKGQKASQTFLLLLIQEKDTVT